jgi:hypothetical protein
LRGKHENTLSARAVIDNFIKPSGVFFYFAHPVGRISENQQPVQAWRAVFFFARLGIPPFFG